MKRWQLLVATLTAHVAIASCLIVPNPSPDDSGFSTVAGSTVTKHVQVEFTIPCEDCFPSQKGLSIKLSLPATDGTCTSSLENTFINNARLTPVASDSSSTISGVTSFNTSNALPAGSLSFDATWTKACDPDALSSISVSINHIDGVPVKERAFSVVYQQQLLHVPDVLGVYGAAATLQNIRLISDFVKLHHSSEIGYHVIEPVQTIEDEFAKLDLIKEQLYFYHHQYVQQEHRIISIIGQGFDTCTGVRCYLQTALSKAPDVFALIRTHFKHKSSSKTDSSLCPTSWFKTGQSSLNGAGLDNPDGTAISTRPTANIASRTMSSLPTNAASSQPSVVSNVLATSTSAAAASSSTPKISRPSQTSSTPPSDPKVSPSRQGSSRLLNPNPRYKHYRFIISIVGTLTSLLILVVLLLLAHRYFNNPRVRADRLARIEEHRNRRAYRKAACQHRFRQFLAQFKWKRRSSEEGTDDYEEKREALLRAQREGEDSGIIHNNLNALRRAHEIVSALVRAEEGRSTHYTSPPQHTHSYPESSAPSYRTYDPNVSFSSRQHSRNIAAGSRSDSSITTLPPYSLPPRYSCELPADTQVVNGFRYTPSNSDTTPSSSVSSFIINDSEDEDGIATESSVVDCRSRLSVDTSEADAESIRAGIRPFTRIV